MTLNARTHLPTTWLLTLILILTPWLSFWATPVLAQNYQGEVVVLCTLNGLQRVAAKQTDTTSNDLYTGGNLSTESFAQNQANERCSALELKKAFSQGLMLAPAAISLTYYPPQISQAGSFTFQRNALFNAYHGRAPPLS